MIHTILMVRIPVYLLETPHGFDVDLDLADMTLNQKVDLTISIATRLTPGSHLEARDLDTAD